MDYLPILEPSQRSSPLYRRRVAERLKSLYVV